MENLFGKGEQELDKVMDNPADVNKGEQEADKLLEKYVPAPAAEEITKLGAGELEKYTDRQGQ